MKEKKFKKLLDLRDKIPTAAQTRKYLKDEWHSWTDLEKSIAAVVLLPNDVSICIADNETLKQRYGDKYEEIRNKSHERLAYLDFLLENMTLAIQNYNDYKNGIKKSEPGDIPMEFKWSMKRYNYHAKLMGFIHQLDIKREMDFNNIKELIIDPKDLLGLE